MYLNKVVVHYWHPPKVVSSPGSWCLPMDCWGQLLHVSLASPGTGIRKSPRTWPSPYIYIKGQIGRVQKAEVQTINPIPQPGPANYLSNIL